MSSPFHSVAFFVLIDVEAFRLGHQTRIPSEIQCEISFLSQSVFQFDVELLAWRVLQHSGDFQCESLGSNDGLRTNSFNIQKSDNLLASFEIVCMVKKKVVRRNISDSDGRCSANELLRLSSHSISFQFV